METQEEIMIATKSRKSRYTRKPPVSTPPAGKFVKRQILSANEAEFHRLLVESAGNDYQVFPKVALKDVVKPTERSDFPRLQAKHIDFVIAGSNGRAAIAAIELDDASHDNQTNRQHDAVKDFYLNSAGIPVIRIRGREAQSITPTQLRELYLSAKADSNRAYPIESVDRPDAQSNIKKLLLLIALALLFLWFTGII